MKTILKKLLSRIGESASSSLKIAGFTMIELLIVIAILGILAVAVLSAINPIEQINRGRDTGSRSDAEQLVSAIDRYNAFQGFYPWQTGATDTANQALPFTLFNDFGVITDSNDCAIDDKLGEGVAGCAGADELKITYFNRIFDPGYNHLSIYNSGNQGNSTYVCFVPQSRAFVTEAQARCQNDSGIGLPTDLQAVGTTVCAGFADPDANDIYVCLP